MRDKDERLFNLHIMLLNAKKPVSARQIQQTIKGYDTENFESFKRMFERDKEALREIGIPIAIEVIDDTDNEEGYIIPKDRYYLPQLDLSKEEIASLWLAAGLLQVMDQGPLFAGLMKLSGQQDADQSQGSERLAADLGLGVPNLPRLFEATNERRRILFKHQSGQETKLRKVRPYRLVNRHGFWYVAGLDEDSATTKTFRVDRIVGEVRFVDVGKSGPDYEIPADFDADAPLATPPFAQGERGFTARVRFASTTAWWAARANPWLRMEVADDGSAEVDVQVTDPESFVSWLLSFGADAEVLSPEELRHQARQVLEALCKGAGDHG